MSFKHRIYVIAGLLIAVAIIIGAVGIVSMRSIHQAMEVETDIAMKVSTLKEVRSDMWNALLAMREIVLADDMEEMRKEKASVDHIIANEVDPIFAEFEVMPQDQEKWNKLRQT